MEVSVEENKTRVYNYDNGGNITSINEYAYTTGTLGSATNTISYSYTDTNWRDKLTSYNGQAITYDEIGNPISYRGYTMGWSNGRELTSLSGNGLTATYTYDASGLRLSKTVNGVKTEYEYQDGKLMYEKKGDMELYYGYDAEGQPCYIQFVKADGTTGASYLITNSRGDVVGICNANGVMVANYTYDAWGNVLSATDQNGNAITSAGHLGNLNSIRYRGYYYDTDTGMYYLKSRYYDPKVRRFINADDVSVLEEDQGNIVENNLFAYCLNNPVNLLDSEGDFAITASITAYTLTTLVMSAGVSIMITQDIYNVYRGKKEFYRKYKAKKNSHNFVVSKAHSRIKTTVRKKSKTRYWSATVKKGYVDIGRALTYRQAVKEVSRGRSVFTVTSYEAKAVAIAAGGKTGKNNKKLFSEIDKGKKNVPGYYYYYHTYNRKGGHVYYLF